MPKTNQPALDFLLSRRSVPVRALTLPVPDRDQLRVILTAAARSPDHGKLEPWRFIVLEKPALTRLSELSVACGARAGIDADRVAKVSGLLAGANLVVAVVQVPRTPVKVPLSEQVYAVGGVCLALVNAAQAAGYGANWLSGWIGFDRGFMEQGLGLAPDESIAGFIHIGTETAVPPERPRPDLDRITTWVAE